MQRNPKIKFSGKATYRITIQGEINTARSDQLGGMRIETIVDSENGTISVLTGLLKDQAELSGIMNTLYEMHYAVLSVECLGVDTNDKNSIIS